MLDKLKKIFLVGLGATYIGKKKIKKLYKIGKKNEEKGEYIFDQLMAGIGEGRKAAGKIVKKARPLAKRATKRAKPFAKIMLRKAKPKRRAAKRRKKR